VLAVSSPSITVSMSSAGTDSACCPCHASDNKGPKCCRSTLEQNHLGYMFTKFIFSEYDSIQAGICRACINEWNNSQEYQQKVGKRKTNTTVTIHLYCHTTGWFPSNYCFFFLIFSTRRSREREKDHLKKETFFEKLCVLCVLTTEYFLINISDRN